MKLLRIEIASFRPESADAYPVAEKDRKALEKAVLTDPVALVEYWSVDTDYDGAVHRPSAVFTREKGVLNTVFEKTGKEFGRISVRAFDAFGNSANRDMRL